jgi:2-hydroxychromene-2-carboxylate isomerase
MTQQIELFYDFRSPYSYLAFARLRPSRTWGPTLRGGTVGGPTARQRHGRR